MAEGDTIIEGPLYAARKKVYPQAVQGLFRRVKWAILVVTLGIYYLVPFLRWDRGPNLPNQAVLVDLPHRRFYFFFVELWPQEVYYFTGLLIIAAMTLFLMNAVAGRLWCGYMCPQTVWTDLFYAVERWVEGDRRERMKKDKGGWSADIVAQKLLKHSIWLMIAWWTGGAWVLYFSDAPTLVRDLATLQAPWVAYVWIGILTFTTYALAGFMREQVCIYMCPWPRIQAALTDEWALNVTYRSDRGEPRMSVKKAEHARERGEKAGDCVDCRQCIAVCPTGVDIRDGIQLGCIQCGLCIDACDTVMKEIGRPTGLIGYDTDINIACRASGKPTVRKVVRPRTILYAAVIGTVGAIMLYALLTRPTMDLSVLHERNPLFTRLSDGSVRNDYTVRLLNKRPIDRSFELGISGLPGAVLRAVGAEETAGGGVVLTVGPDQTSAVRVLVSTPKSAIPHESTDLVFTLRDTATGESSVVKDHFIPH
ncbi:cytochrome c oxidase accessory protein CcoG [Alsobacter sp. SYSU M60028]|uniref:Cytochrome c oxidase accessory protein CcoG n=1 Tax=Alsobacter ponti TaxID=2962936 RepID=A0ABT1LKS3_9HYPH|nr:cytochrome c oxidase accessory protein CcoG [Alsobacter ponti]MCP8940848.1 cytochrome c oxidase accessory protein CcoG [Alsobacter ponti]